MIRNSLIVTNQMYQQVQFLEFEGGTTIQVGARVMLTSHPFRAVLDGVLLWKEGKVIQEALPFMSVEQREFIMTGLDSEGWKDLFGDEGPGEPCDARR